jgi:hypothetical protein
LLFVSALLLGCVIAQKSSLAENPNDKGQIDKQQNNKKIPQNGH